MKLPRPRPTTWLALAAIVVGIAAVVVSVVSDRLDGWMTNVATDAFLLAATILVVERIVRGEGKRRIAPRVERVLWRVGSTMREVVTMIVIDYADRHARTFKRPPNDVLGALDHWLTEERNEDVPRSEADEEPRDPYPMLVHSAGRVAREIKTDVAPDREVLEPDLVRASDDYSWRVGHAAMVIEFVIEGLLDDRAETERHARRTAVQATRDFAEVFLGHADRGWAEVDDLTLRAAEERSQWRVRHLEHPERSDEPPGW